MACHVLSSNWTRFLLGWRGPFPVPGVLHPTFKAESPSACPLYCAHYPVSRDGDGPEKNKSETATIANVSAPSEVEPDRRCANQHEADRNNDSGDRDTESVKAPPPP
jgi:hypothetical protein